MTEEVIDDSPDKVKSDLRKFNKAEQQVGKAIAELQKIGRLEKKEDVDIALDVIARSKKVEKIIEDKRVSLVKPYNDEVSRINNYAKSLKEKLPPMIKQASDHVLDYNRREEERKKKLLVDSRITQLASLDFTRDELEGEWSSYRNGEISVDRFSIENFDEQLWSRKVDQLVQALKERNQREAAALLQQQAADDFFGDGLIDSSIQEKIEQLKAEPVVAPVTHVPAFGSKAVKGVTKRWTFEVTDPTLVPREYLVVDEGKIRTAMNAGTRDIPGVRFFQTESLTSR